MSRAERTAHATRARTALGPDRKSRSSREQHSGRGGRGRGGAEAACREHIGQGRGCMQGPRRTGAGHAQAEGAGRDVGECTGRGEGHGVGGACRAGGAGHGAGWGRGGAGGAQGARRTGAGQAKGPSSGHRGWIRSLSSKGPRRRPRSHFVVNFDRRRSSSPRHFILLLTSVTPMAVTAAECTEVTEHATSSRTAWGPACRPPAHSRGGLRQRSVHRGDDALLCKMQGSNVPTTSPRSCRPTSPAVSWVPPR